MIRGSITMPSSLYGRTVSTALAVLVASLALAPPVGAIVDCCRVGSLPPMMSGFFLPAGTAEEAHDQATRLGFKPIWRPGEGEIRAGLDRGFLWWQPGYRAFEFGGIPASRGYLFVSGPLYPLCGPVVIPDRPEFSTAATSDGTTLTFLWPNDCEGHAVAGSPRAARAGSA